MTDLLSELEAVPVVAYAWRKEGMNGWALGHNPPTSNMPDFDKYEVRELTFLTHHAEIAAAVRDASRYRWLRDLPDARAERAMCPNAEGGVVMHQGKTLDAAIDHAMRAGEGEG